VRAHGVVEHGVLQRAGAVGAHFTHRDQSFRAIVIAGFSDRDHLSVA